MSGRTRSQKRLVRAVAESLESRRLLSLVVPNFHTHPTATAKLYLDFVGTPAFDWDGTRRAWPRIRQRRADSSVHHGRRC